MKTFVCVLVAILAGTAGLRAAPEPSATPKTSEQPDKRKAALEKFGQAVQSGRDVEQAAAEAEKAGVAAQTIAEFRLLSAVRSRDAKELALRLKEVEGKVVASWRSEDSIAFEEKSELEAVIFFAKALLAAETGDETAFEQSMKQAFWLNPELSPALAEELKARRAKVRQATLVLPMATSFETSAGAKTSLAELVRGKKALLLDFWATWCGPCMAALPHLVERERELAPQQVAVVGINTEATQSGGMAEARKKAENVKKQKKIEFAWLVEPLEQPLTKLLKIDSIPRAILVSPEGKVLYDGHPEDSRLAVALKEIGVTLRD